MKVGDVVKVKVLSVDVKKRRIGLTMRGREAELTRPEFLENRRKNARVCPGGRDPGRKAHPRVGVFKHFEKEL